MHRRVDQPGVKIGAARRKAAFVFIFATILLDMLAMGIVIPVLPKLVVDFVGGDTQEAAKVFGLFGTAWALMQFLFAPLQGTLSDSFGRRPVILISNFGVGLDYVLMALAPTLGWLFAGRVLSGIASSSIATAYAYVADRRRISALRASDCWALRLAPDLFLVPRSAAGLAASLRGCRFGLLRA